MIRHVILWRLKEEYSEEQKAEILRNMHRAFEELNGKVPGLVECTCRVDKLDTSTCDAMLDSVLESYDALLAYRTHPAHVHVADTYVRPFTSLRVCMDYEIE